MAAPIMAAATNVSRSSFLPPSQVSTSSPTTAVPALVIVPSTPTRIPVGASLRLGDSAMSLSPAIFSASGSPLFSPEVDDDDDVNTLKLAAHVLSPSECGSVLSGHEWNISSSCVVVVLIQRTYAWKYFAVLDSALKVVKNV